MSDKDRRAFLKTISMASLASVLVPRMLLAESKSVNSDDDGKKTKSLVPKDEEDFRIIDMHIHPAQKIYLLGKVFWHRHHPIPGPNMFRVEVDTRELDSGWMKGLVASHYMPEMGITKKWDLLKGLFKGRNIFGRGVKRILFEDGNMSNYPRLLHMMCELNEQVEKSNRKYYHGKNEIVIAHSYEEFASAIANNQIPLAHAIEGAHALGRIKPMRAKERKAYELRHEEPYKTMYDTAVAVKDEAANKSALADYHAKVQIEFEQAMKELGIGVKKNEAKEVIAKLEDPSRKQT